mmetsp:Transcript_19552/g.41148  ORF Transcript_19552/g.41148 Transcript_19552/m.41148 type:complete len:362 (-) Transcript_19552:515-1600(-)
MVSPPAAAIPRVSRSHFGSIAVATHAATMRAPPTPSHRPSCSCSRKLAKTAAHSGSVASRTEASEEESLPSATVSPTRLPAVVTKPVKAAARATLRKASSRNRPGRVKVDRTASSSNQAPWGLPKEKAWSATPRPSSRAQAPARAADMAHCMAVMGSAWEGSLAIIRSVMKKEVPNPTACRTDQKSPHPTAAAPVPASPPPSSRTPTPTRQVTAAIHVWGASRKPIFLLSTSTASAGHTITTRAPKKDTVAAGVSTSAMLWEMYPTAVKVPHTAAVLRSSGLSWNKKGDSASEASTMRVEVAALAGMASFIRRPRGKLVPYRTLQISSRARGQMYARDNRSGASAFSPLGSHTTSLRSSLR